SSRCPILTDMIVSMVACPPPGSTYCTDIMLNQISTVLLIPVDVAMPAQYMHIGKRCQHLIDQPCSSRYPNTSRGLLSTSTNRRSIEQRNVHRDDQRLSLILNSG